MRFADVDAQKLDLVAVTAFQILQDPELGSIRSSGEAAKDQYHRLLAAILTFEAMRGILDDANLAGFPRMTVDRAPDALDVAPLAPVPPAQRRRVLRRWLLDAGVAELTEAHLRAADDLIGRWSGQGALRLPGNVELARAQGRLHVSG